MGHVREATLAIDKTATDFPEKIQALWDKGLCVRVDAGDSVTVHGTTSEMLKAATAIVRGEKEEIDDDDDDTPDSDPAD